MTNFAHTIPLLEMVTFAVSAGPMMTPPLEAVRSAKNVSAGSGMVSTNVSTDTKASKDPAEMGTNTLTAV